MENQEIMLQDSIKVVKQYIASETKNIESMNKLIEWLPKNIPANDQTSIVHGDFRLDNIVFSQNNVLGVLDWELSTLGHPIADLIITVLIGEIYQNYKMKSFVKRSGIPTEKEYLAMYCENTGNDISYDWDFIIFLISLSLQEFCKESWVGLEMELLPANTQKKDAIKLFH